MATPNPGNNRRKPPGGGNGNAVKTQPIMVRRPRRRESRHHGGAWKVAYADFVTALMAFFLVMWLLVATTPTLRIGIAGYFHNAGASPIQGPGGASTSMIKLGGTRDMAPTPLQQNHLGVMTPRSGGSGESYSHAMQTLEIQLRRAIEASEALRPFKDQLLINLSPDGMRLQIVDKQNRPMFALGSAKLLPYAQVILQQVGAFLAKRPYQISVVGETDAYKFVDKSKSNWQLSTERANAAWRAMVAGGLPRARIAQVTGFGDRVLFDTKNPKDPINRRISIVVLTPKAAAKLLKQERQQ